MDITNEQVKAVLTALGEEFTIDIPAVHNASGYWIEYSELNAYLILADEATVEEVAEYVRTNG